MNTKRSSKFLSLVLRHKPETIGITLDENGWVSVDKLLEALAQHNRTMTESELNELVRTNDKQRFIIEGSRIRANQGHSVSIDLALEPRRPPAKLFHGTAERFIDKILNQGLRKMSRQHVHLSTNIEIASKVGIRHGKLALLEIDTARMYDEGCLFYLSENGVWLVENVPTNYIKVYNSDA